MDLAHKRLGDLVDEMIQMAVKQSQGVKVEIGVYEMYKREINKREEKLYKYGHEKIQNQNS